FVDGNQRPVRSVPSADLKRSSSHLAPTRSGSRCMERSGWRKTLVQPESATVTARKRALIVDRPIKPQLAVRAADGAVEPQRTVGRRGPVEAQANPVIRSRIAERAGGQRA